MPAPPAFGDQDYRDAMLRLLPRGPIWRRDPSSILAATLQALAPTYTRSTTSAGALLVDAFPMTTLNLLPEWEQSLGLPDECTAPDASVLQRQAAVRAKWLGRGGSTTAWFVAMAAALGYAITITEFVPYTVDLPVDLPLVDEGWEFVWQVDTLALVTWYFSVDQSGVDDPLEDYTQSELVCRITREAPAGTIVFFTGLPAAGLWDDGGILCVTPDALWPGPDGLGAGAIYSNNGVASARPGGTLDISAPPVLFGGVTAAELLALDSGELRWTAPPPGSGILWVPGGILGGDICVA